ncbi:SPOR domain-containing protein [Pseudooceanicola sp. HF7]|uniref:SPOR domain-containing protein n=1 Tax=Pseudooceanicola sp. HF7 TaxID=2721560 RepID=UPI00143068A4|nr:SPOR domain-containing protein [Pseudooceanicola sp. HF7]NIZ08795.1 SPOR domain-containing protein [Pseudooceanicola sp. HF7]
MAEYQADGFAPVEAVSFGRMVTIVGGVLSFALVAGVVFWGYQMVMRDVSGVPVVRAMTGEIRRMPENAGGQTAAFQGFAVNRVAAGEGTDGIADRVALAPEPVRLGQEGMTERELAVAMRIEEEANTRPVPMDTALTMTAPEAMEEIAPQNGADSDLAPEEGAELAEATPEAPAPKIVGGGLGYSVTPRLRPGDLSQTHAAAAAAAAAAPPKPTVQFASAADVTPGSRLAQLGAFDSETVAEQEWTRLMRSFSIYLEDKQRVIQRAVVGGRAYYRLRAMGFEDLADARRFCAALVAGNADCIPVVSE